MIATVSSLLVALGDEVVFRGWLQHWLGRRLRGGPPMSVVVGGVLFAASRAPIQPPGWLPAYFALGLVLGWLKLRTGSLAAPIALHVGANGVLLALG